MQSEECIQFLSPEEFAGDKICFEQLGSDTDCTVSLNDNPCNECRVVECDNGEEGNLFDCTNVGGSVYKDCLAIEESPDTPFVFWDNQIYDELFPDEEEGCNEVPIAGTPPVPTLSLPKGRAKVKDTGTPIVW